MSSTPATILVVDDNPATRYSTGRVLKSAGYRILEAGTGQAALTLAREKPDLIVLDVNLPDMNGYEVCRHFRAIPETARTPVVHLSASFISDHDKIHGFEAGADGYITHPVEPPVLIGTVRAFLRARMAEDAQIESEAKFKAVFDQAVNGIALLDRSLKFVEVNPAVELMLATERGSLVGQPLEAFVAEDHRNALDSIEPRLASNGLWRGSLSMTRPDGLPVDLEWNVSELSGSGLRVAIATDVTERNRIANQVRELLASERAARTEAERANRLKDDFLAALSHELRSPLNIIVGWSQMLRRKAEGADDDVRRGLDAIERNAKIQTQLIGDLLDVARITSGKLRFEAQHFDPRVAVLAALENARVVAASRGVQVHVDVERSSTSVAWDPSRFQQVVWNLVDNAVKFTPAGGRVDITLVARETGLEMAIQDTGRGISEEFLPYVFDRFRQEDAGTRRWHGGLGLGLAIVKHVVELQGGTISVASDGEGRGATFTVLFKDVPNVEPRPAGDPTSTGRIARTSLASVRVLLVEDDDDARAVVGRLLTDAGADVAGVGSAAEAIDALDRFAPQIIVSDIGMPGVDGYDLIRTIRQRGGPTEDVPAIALTAFVREDDRRRAVAAGYNAHLPKPIDAARLLETVQSLVSGRGTLL